MFVNESQDEFFNFDDGSSCGNMATPKIECLRYLDEAHSSSLNVLHAYPHVKSLFRVRNDTVPSSEPVERLFSKGDLISVPRRNRLSDNILSSNCCWKAVAAVTVEANKFIMG